MNACLGWSAKVKDAQMLVDLAYKIPKGETTYMEYETRAFENFKNDNKEWQVLCNSSQFSDTSQGGYKAVVFVQPDTKEVLIATAGTVVADIHDLIDDAYVASGSFPSKVVQLKSMLDHVIGLLGDEANNYKFDVTGHSLGAVLADMTAFEIKSRGLNLGTSITFDSPGSKNSIEKAIESKVFSGEGNVVIGDLVKHCEVFNSPHNLVNKSRTHIAAPHFILPSEEVVANKAESAGIWRFADYLFNKVGSVVKTCSDYLGITSVLNDLGSLKYHSLKNFADLDKKFVVSTEDWNKTFDNKLVIKNSFLLNKITSTGSDVITLQEEDIDDNTVSVSSNEFSYADLYRANNYKNDTDLLGEDLDFPSIEFIY